MDSEIIKPINLRKTDFRVIISKNLRNRIKIWVIKAGGPIELYRKTKLTPTIYHRLLIGKGIHAEFYCQLPDFLSFDLKSTHSEIIGLTYNGGKFVYPYIDIIDPLFFRIICHITGDGTISSKNTCRWIQHKDNSYWLKDLIKKKLGFMPTVSKGGADTCEMVTISAFFSRIFHYSMGLDVKQLKDPELLEKFICLPKDYRLQFLAAFIVDEGHIRYKGAHSLIISQAKRPLLESIVRIIDSLGYQHSNIFTEYRSENGTVIYRLNIYMQGVLDFNKNINLQMEKYGSYAGLWHKQCNLEKYVASSSGNIKYHKIWKDETYRIIIDIFRQKTILSYEDLRTHPCLNKRNLSEKYLIQRLYELNRAGTIKRVSKGIYAFVKQKHI